MKTRVALALLLAIAVAVAAVAVRYPDFRKLAFHRLPGRASWQLPERTVAALAVEPGDRVADLGAGSGYFVGFLADAVGPSGRVYAVEVSRRALESLERKVRDENLTNVEVVEASAADPGLPDGAIDLVFLCDVYHHIDGRVDYFQRLASDLASGGRVAVVEPRAQGFGRLVSPAGHATPAAELIAEMERAGYRLEESFDFLPVQNLLVFRPADRPAPAGPALAAERAEGPAYPPR